MRTEEGKVYYVNHNDRTTQWDDPRLVEVNAAIETVAQMPSTPKPSHNFDDTPLPAGWVRQELDDGRVYFIDHNTLRKQG